MGPVWPHRSRRELTVGRGLVKVISGNSSAVNVRNLLEGWPLFRQMTGADFATRIVRVGVQLQAIGPLAACRVVVSVMVPETVPV